MCAAPGPRPSGGGLARAWRRAEHACRIRQARRRCPPRGPSTRPHPEQPSFRRVFCWVPRARWLRCARVGAPGVERAAAGGRSMTESRSTGPAHESCRCRPPALAPPFSSRSSWRVDDNTEDLPAEMRRPSGATASAAVRNSKGSADGCDIRVMSSAYSRYTGGKTLHVVRVRPLAA